MKRREILSFLGGAATTAIWPSVGNGQTSSKRIIGNLASASITSAAPQLNAVLEGLREFGYVEGRDYEFVHLSANGLLNQLPSLAEDMVRRRPDVIMANPTPAIIAARRATSTIPIVSFMIANEMQLGLVASHSRPGGNVTGLLMRVDGMVGKQIELAKQTIPDAKRFAILLNPSSPDVAAQRREAEAAAVALNVEYRPVEAGTPEQIDAAFQQYKKTGVDVVAVLYDAMFFQERQRIAGLAAVSRVPAIYAARDHVAAGGLMSYGISLRASAKRVAAYIDKIFKGANAGDLPLEFPTKLELVINKRAATALGLEIPPTVFVTADEVID